MLVKTMYTHVVKLQLWTVGNDGNEQEVCGCRRVCLVVRVCVSVVLVGAEWVFRFSFWFITMASCCILDSQDTAITGNDQFVN